MITVRLMGGLGNQLFQAAFALALRHRKREVQLDPCRYRFDAARSYMLDRFELDLPLGDGAGVTFLEKTFDYYPQAFNFPETECEAVGYWQNELYFKDIAEQVLKAFTPRSPLSPSTLKLADEILSLEHSAFIHVRRSDNLSLRAQRYHGLLDDEYYRAAIDTMRATVTGMKFYVFSDDPDWCVGREEFMDMTVMRANPMSGMFDEHGNIVKNDTGREHEDLWLMSLCRHAIVANSTFSWWGAWLNATPLSDRMVIGPKRWFVDPSMAAFNPVPADWLTL